MNQAAPPARRPIAALVVLALGTFMTLLDLTIVNVAIPRISEGLHASLDEILWVLNAYSLLYAVLLITAGRVGDIFGPRTLFVVGTAVFTLASLTSGLAQSPTQLILSRAGQGLGAAILAPQGLPILLSLFPPAKRGGVFAVFGILAGLAVLAGPTLGGFLTTTFGWQSIFYVNIPIGILTIVATFVLVPDLRPGVRHRLDLVGVTLVTLGLFGVVYGLIEGQRYDWGTVTGLLTIPMIIAAGAAVLIVFLVHQATHQHAEPLLDFAVFADRNFSVMTFVLWAMGFAILGFYLPLTIFLQSVLGMSAFDAGLTIAPQPLMVMVMSGVATALLTRFSPKYLIIPGLLVYALGTGLVIAAAQASATRWSFLPGLLVAGAGMAFIWGPVYAAATRDLKPELAGVGSGVLNTIQELGGVVAGAIIGAVLQNRLAVNLHDEAVVRAASLPEPARAQFISGFSSAAKGGLEIGAGQTGAPVAAPQGLPPAAIAQLQQAAHDVFVNAFVGAMRPTLIIGLGVVVFAALVTLTARARPLRTAGTGDDAAAA